MSVEVKLINGEIVSGLKESEYEDFYSALQAWKPKCESTKRKANTNLWISQHIEIDWEQLRAQAAEDRRQLREQWERVRPSTSSPTSYWADVEWTERSRIGGQQTSYVDNAIPDREPSTPPARVDAEHRGGRGLAGSREQSMRAREANRAQWRRFINSIND